MPKISLDGVTLHYRDAGDGDPPVVLLHAFPLHSGMWAPQMEALAPLRRVIAPDLKGFGSSDAPDDPAAYTMDAYADEVAALLARLGVSRAVLVGLSMGGYVAFALLRRHGDLVAGLVLADTRAGADDPEVLDRRSSQQRQVAESGTPAVIEALLEGLLSERTFAEAPEVVDRARKLMDNPPAGFIGALEAMKRRPDSSGELGAVGVPTLVVVGEHDRPSPPAVAEGMQRAIPGARLVVLPGAGHLSNLEAPGRFNAALLDLVESVRS